MYDIEMIRELGFCSGIENYSRYLSGREEGEPPPCLIDYLPKDSLIIIDESHVTIPQLRGMYKGDHSRKPHWLNMVLGSHLRWIIDHLCMKNLMICQSKQFMSLPHRETMN